MPKIRFMPHTEALKTNLPEVCDISTFFETVKKGELDEFYALYYTDLHLTAADAQGRTALHWAADHGHLFITKFLLKEGAAVNVFDLTRSTPLHLAANRGHFYTTQMLLAAGADFKAENIDHKTPLQLAEEKQQHNIIGLIRAHWENKIEQEINALQTEFKVQHQRLNHLIHYVQHRFLQTDKLWPLHQTQHSTFTWSQSASQIQSSQASPTTTTPLLTKAPGPYTASDINQLLRQLVRHGIEANVLPVPQHPTAFIEALQSTAALVSLSNHQNQQINPQLPSLLPFAIQLKTQQNNHSGMSHPHWVGLLIKPVKEGQFDVLYVDPKKNKMPDFLMVSLHHLIGTKLNKLIVCSVGSPINDEDTGSALVEYLVYLLRHQVPQKNATTLGQTHAQLLPSPSSPSFQEQDKCSFAVSPSTSSSQIHDPFLSDSCDKFSFFQNTEDHPVEMPIGDPAPMSPWVIEKLKQLVP